jgi:polysaccharide deacetylase 2 family uncharacterized protein YibQ
VIRAKVLLAAAALLLVADSTATLPPRVAIIIDDLGYHFAAGRRAIDLPGPLAYAILPATPRGEALARLAYERGKEVLLHLPLQAVARDGWAEPGGIVLDMSRTAFGDAFSKALDSVPNAVGVSSHRGSLLTRHPGHMGWLMDEISSREGLFFIDSYTTHHSVALRIARESGVPAVKRDVFLDHDPSEPTIRRELERLKALARERGSAVAIGHPYPETLRVLEEALPALAEEGIELVPLSRLVDQALNPTG